MGERGTQEEPRLEDGEETLKCPVLESGLQHQEAKPWQRQVHLFEKHPPSPRNVVQGANSAGCGGKRLHMAVQGTEGVSRKARMLGI